MHDPITETATDAQSLMPTSELFRKYPWVKFFSTAPQSTLGSVLLREQTVGGISMLPTDSVREFLKTMNCAAKKIETLLH